jgi:uncharacterized membrane protein YfcA
VTSTELLGSILAFLLGSVLQSAVGFGAGLLAMPILVWVGMPLAKAIAMMLGVVSIHAGYNLYLGRSDFRWRWIRDVTLLRWASIPVGVWILETFLLHSRALAKQAVGGVILLSLVLTAKSTKDPRPHVHPGWLWLTGISSGILAGSVGLGGPPLVLYALSHDWTNGRTKAYLWASYVLGSPFVVLILWWRLGPETLQHWLIGMAHAPVVWAGSHIGLRLTKTQSRETLQKISFAALAVIALISIFAPGIAG